MKLSELDLFFLLCLTLTNCVTGEDCTFKENPDGLVLVSETLTTKVKIGKHFELNVFEEFCLLKVKLPQGNVITFNLTKEMEDDKHFGDLLTDQIWVSKDRNLVYFINTTEEFGPRFGYYFINGFEILGTRYSNVPYKYPDENDVVIQNCETTEEKNGTIKIDDISKNDPRIGLCFEYNEQKNKSTGEYIFGENCMSPTNVSLYNRTFYFSAEHLPYKICCRIEDPVDKTNDVEYSNIIPTKTPICPISAQTQTSLSISSIFSYVGIPLFLIFLIGGCLLFRHKKKKYKHTLGLHYLKPRVPDWGRCLSYDRGLIKINMEDPLGKGTFGIVYKAVAQQFEERICNVEVAVKTYPPESIQGHDDLYQEGEVLSALEFHPNIINLLGISLDTVEKHSRLLLIIELCSKGCLLEILWKKDEAFINKSETWTEDFNPEIMTLWSFQISRGMEFLSMKRIIHGDLAARNILLDGDNNVKINDFGKARQVNYDNIAVGVDGIQPLAWMAVEAIQRKQINLQSDIWSFGITLWEMFSLGLHPYAERSFDETFELLVKGDRLPTPSDCPSQIYQVMTKCWHGDPLQRPSFQDLTTRLKSMVDNKYLEKYWRIQDRQKKVYQSIRKISGKDNSQMVVYST